MVFGTCVVRGPRGNAVPLAPQSITINGQQDGFLLHFVITQVFQHSSSKSEEIRYIVLNSNKMCMYGITFRIGAEEIPVEVVEKTAAGEMFAEAKKEGRGSLLAETIGDSLVHFELGNIPPGQPCVISFHCAFCATSAGVSSTFFKFPLEVCNPNGSIASITRNFRGSFEFSLENVNPASVLAMSASVPSVYDKEAGRIRIGSAGNASAIFVTTVLNESLRSMCLTAGRYLAATAYVPYVPKETRKNSEFVFVIDCSGSMSGTRMSQARVCLSLFIRSLPASSFFNVVRFGETFEALFPQTVKYDQTTAEKALEFAGRMLANLGGTQIYEPLESVFSQPRKGEDVRQLFVITDGEVSNTDRVIALGTNNARANRCFTIGIGNGADAGLVEGLAEATGGKADFVLNEEDLPGKVIAQLEASLRPRMTRVAIEVSRPGTIEFAPFPLPQVTPLLPQTVFGAAPELFGTGQVLLSGWLAGKQVDEAICTRETTIGETGLRALFALEKIRIFEHCHKDDDDMRSQIVRLSVESGVLCRETAFVGFSPRKPRPVVTSRLRSPRACGLWGMKRTGSSDSATIPVRPIAMDNDRRVVDMPQDRMLGLVGLQGFDGCWADPQAIQKALGLNVQCTT
jgi:hypothetical protein